MNLPTKIQDFYNRIQFPGSYSKEELDFHWPKIKNYYLKTINSYIKDTRSVIDVGCGSGLTTNLFAQHHPNVEFTGIDMSQGIYYAAAFANKHQIKNVSFYHHDLLDYDTEKKYDLVICQGVLHHIPDQMGAINKLQQLTAPGGILIVGVYHPWGKILKKFLKLSYSGSDILKQDQTCNPYEISYNKKKICSLFDQFQFVSAYPKFGRWSALLRSNSGGLTVYVWRNNV